MLAATAALVVYRTLKTVCERSRSVGYHRAVRFQRKRARQQCDREANPTHMHMGHTVITMPRNPYCVQSTNTQYIEGIQFRSVCFYFVAELSGPLCMFVCLYVCMCGMKACSRV